MKLRWFRTCNKHGLKTDLTLQYWDTAFHVWSEIPTVECKDHEEEKYMQNEDYDH